MNSHVRVSTPKRSSASDARPDSPSGRAFVLPLIFTASFLAAALYAPLRENSRLLWSFLGTGVVLLAWSAVLFTSQRRQTLTYSVELRPQHYVQACAHTSILLYWGWYWHPVYEHLYLIAAQLLFAYAFDILLTWSQRDSYILGFGPFPIVFSTNLFLWFRNDWFYLQFLMLAVGFSAKALIRWNRDGRQTHIFNPSSFTLTVFSLALLITGTTNITWGQDIAVTQFYPPHMYLFLFTVALPGQLLFGVTTMTMSAVVTTYLWGLAYFAYTGTYYFFDSYIPIAVFLGMHLLFTDPSTAPRTEGGRICFGALYGLSTVALYELLGVAGLPTFYDKLLQVPLMNLSVIAIDRAVRSTWLSRCDPGRLVPSLSGRPRHLAYISVWFVVFGAMSAAQGVGDRHPGQWLPFWQQACLENRTGACRYLEQMYATYCRAGSEWSCRELEGRGSVRVPASASASAAATSPTAIGQTVPPIEDLPIVLRGSKAPITERRPAALLELACAQGWPGSCGGAATSAVE